MSFCLAVSQRMRIFARKYTKKAEMGVTYDSKEQRFVFDFEHDGAEDIVSLIGRKDLMAEAI